MYENKGNGDLRLSHKLPVAFSTDKWRANFGRAIAAVGDIDLDGFQGTTKQNLMENNYSGIPIFRTS